MLNQKNAMMMLYSVAILCCLLACKYNNNNHGLKLRQVRKPNHDCYAFVRIICRHSEIGRNRKAWYLLSLHALFQVSPALSHVLSC